VEADSAARTADRATKTVHRASATSLWAMRLARIYEVCPRVCPRCGAEIRLIAFVTEAEPVRRILTHLGEPITPPPISPARSPPVWDAFDGYQTPAVDPANAEPTPEFDFDQTLHW
jgi:hypothetical protein